MIASQGGGLIGKHFCGSVPRFFPLRDPPSPSAGSIFASVCRIFLVCSCWSHVAVRKSSAGPQTQYKQSLGTILTSGDAAGICRWGYSLVVLATAEVCGN